MTRQVPRAKGQGPTANHVWICINGILTRPGDAEGWTDRAVTWLHIHTPVRAEKFEYSSGALTRRLRQQARAEAIARMVGYYARSGYDITFLAHSNGADLVARVLRLADGIRIHSAHLVAAATDGDEFARAIERAQLGSLHLYGSDKDDALRLARLSRSLFGWAGLGYGSLGLEVDRAAALLPRTFSHCDDTHTHSSWWERGERFETTMRLITSREGFLS